MSLGRCLEVLVRGHLVVLPLLRRLLVVRRLLGMSLVAEVTVGWPRRENQPLEIILGLILGLMPQLVRMMV